MLPDVRRQRSLCDRNALSHLVCMDCIFILFLFLSSVKTSRARLTRWLSVLRYLACSQSRAGHVQQHRQHRRPFASLPPITIHHRNVWIPRIETLKVAHTRLPSVGFRSWSRFLAVSLQVTWVINPAVGCHYFPWQLPWQPLRRLLPISLLGEQRHDGCEQFAKTVTRQHRGCDLNPGILRMSPPEPPYHFVYHTIIWRRINAGNWLPI